MTPPLYKADEGRYSGCMRYRRCGRSGVLLPEISLGMWHNFGAEAPLERSVQMACHAFDRGVTHFDLANNYGPPYGTAEETMGRIMRRALAPYRHELFISTKAGYDMWPGPYGNWGSRKYLITSLDQSLRRMGLEYVDLFYSHRFDPETPIEETLQALVDIVRSGRALYIGISRWPLEQTTLAYEYLRSRDVPCLIFQDRYNLLDRSPDTGGILDLAAREGSGFIAFSPLAQGLLTDRYVDGIPAGSRMERDVFLHASDRSPRLLQALQGLGAMARERGLTTAQLALAWVLADERVTSVIVGASSIEQLDANIRTASLPPLTPEERRNISELFKF